MDDKEDDANPVVRVETTTFDAQGRKKVVVQNFPPNPSVPARQCAPSSGAHAKGMVHPEEAMEGTKTKIADIESQAKAQNQENAASPAAEQGCLTRRRLLIIAGLVCLAIVGGAMAAVYILVLSGGNDDPKDFNVDVYHVWYNTWRTVLVKSYADAPMNVGDTSQHDIESGSLDVSLLEVDNEKGTFKVQVVSHPSGWTNCDKTFTISSDLNSDWSTAAGPLRCPGTSYDYSFWQKVQAKVHEN